MTSTIGKLCRRLAERARRTIDAAMSRPDMSLAVVGAGHPEAIVTEAASGYLIVKMKPIDLQSGGTQSGELAAVKSAVAAAVGQIALARAWADALGQHGMTTGQILVTLGDTEERQRYLNARATLNTLLEFGAVPVINENDTVATSEIRYGDNDRLAARVASMTAADCLILLSDVDGLYTAPPSRRDAAFIPEVRAITPEIEAMAGKPVSGLGSGGMITKIEAAKIALGAGCHMAIADQWNIWYLNAGMAESAAKRLEEAAFFHTFDFGFGRRHRTALKGLIERVGLDYFIVDCAETPAGDLLVFEIDNTAVVHDMDSAELYPYKPPQMHKIFDAFTAMLERRAASRRQDVA